MIETLKQFLNNTFNRKNVTSPIEKINNLFSESLCEDTIRLEIGEDLVKFGDAICEKIETIRENFCEETGFIIPLVRTIDNQCLQENKYKIKIRGNTVFTDYVVPNEAWVEEVFPHDFEKTIRNNLSKIFTNEILEKYIESVQKSNSWLVWNVTANLSVSEIKIILLDILEQGKSIKDITYIFEKINEQIFIESRYAYREPHKLAKEVIKSL